MQFYKTAAEIKVGGPAKRLEHPSNASQVCARMPTQAVIEQTLRLDPRPNSTKVSRVRLSRRQLCLASTDLFNQKKKRVYGYRLDNVNVCFRMVTPVRECICTSTRWGSALISGARHRCMRKFSCWSTSHLGSSCRIGQPRCAFLNFFVAFVRCLTRPLSFFVRRGFIVSIPARGRRELNDNFESLYFRADSSHQVKCWAISRLHHFPLRSLTLGYPLVLPWPFRTWQTRKTRHELGATASKREKQTKRCVQLTLQRRPPRQC